MHEWDYLSIEFSEPPGTKALNKLGKKRWELVTLHPMPHGRWFGVFKRQKRYGHG